MCREERVKKFLKFISCACSDKRDTILWNFPNAESSIIYWKFPITIENALTFFTICSIPKAKFAVARHKKLYLYSRILIKDSFVFKMRGRAFEGKQTYTMRDANFSHRVQR